MGITKTQLKKWNDYFNSLTKPQKRVAIAEDVIKQIKAKKYTAKESTYLYISTTVEDEEQLQSNFNNVQCDCCALGGLFLSEVKFNNSCTIGEANDYDFDVKGDTRLQKYFSIEQLILIEAAFECWDAYRLLHNNTIDSGYGFNLKLNELKLTEEDINKACKFGDSFYYEKDKLIAILQNLIQNKGTFKP